MIETEKRAFPGTGKTLIVFTYEGKLREKGYFEKLDKECNGKLARAVSVHSFSGKPNQHIVVEGGSLFDHIMLYGVGKQAVKPAAFREYLGGATRVAAALKTPSVHFFYPESLGEDYEEAGKEIALGFYLAQYRFEKYKGKDERKGSHTIGELRVCMEKDVPSALAKGIKNGVLIGKGIALTRDLINEPASYVHPERLTDEALRIAKESNGIISVKILDRSACRKMGMGAFLGVAEGSDREPQFIVLSYPNKKKGAKKICFVGKSITFDSGGLSLKPAKAMEDMKIDMSGGASVLGVFQALAAGLSTPYEVVGILPACENMPSGKAMRPGDILTAMNGKTIEVLNTDAEGRLALADAVAYAEKTEKPDLIIDFATLTGACMVALGEEIAGVFGNDEKAVKQFIGIAQKQGEHAWEMPLHKPYRELLKSDMADIKNVSGKGYGGAITAALFVGDFVTRTKWIHVDIAGPAYNSGKAQGTVPRGGTGWGIMSVINLLQSA